MLEIIGLVVVAAIIIESYIMIKKKIDETGRITVGEVFTIITGSVMIIVHPISELVSKAQDKGILDKVVYKKESRNDE